jgi:hypothetical protein
MIQEPSSDGSSCVTTVVTDARDDGESGARNEAVNRAVAATILASLVSPGDPSGAAFFEEQETCLVPIASLRQGPVVRSEGVDEQYAKLLASLVTPLPPIVVGAATMVVVDGLHRVRAAVLRQETCVRARYVSGSEAELLIAAVHANAAHGKPLSLADRKGAAARLLSLSPETSDRAVAEVCGLSPTTVGSLRSEHIADEGAGVRKGRDGRFRKIRGKSSPDEGQALSVTSEALDTARVLGPSRRLGRGRLPVAAEDIEDGHMRETVAKPLLTDAAFHASPPLEEFAAWFDNHQVTDDRVVLACSLVPKSRLYEVSAEARSRASFWQKMATRLDGLARGGAPEV